MKHIFIIICLLISSTAFAQSDKKDETKYTEKKPVPSVDVPKYLGANIHYPAEARRNNIQGRVEVKFIVDKHGRVRDVTVAKGIGGGCDEEAIRVVKKMPRWKPGEQFGKKVAVYYTLPINFKLTD